MTEYMTAARLLELREGMTGRDFAVLETVADARLMTAGQLQRLFFPTLEHQSLDSAARTCRRALERLTRDRLLIRLNRQIGGVLAGSAAFVYALGAVGYRLLGRRGRRNADYEPSLVHVRHTTAVAEVVVRLQEHARSGSVEVMQLQREPRCWRRIIGTGRELHPDLYVAVDTSEYELRWFVEVDLGTESLQHLLGKCRTYDLYRRTGIEQAEHGVFPRCLWLMSDPARAERLRRAIERVPKLPTSLFVIGTLDEVTDLMIGGAS